MKLSIITINFNDAKGLEKTIQSVINQTYKDFEYIVVDGASTDGSVDVIKKYSNKLTHWVSEPDTGIYNAMNKGTRMASGEYCLYLNSGDFLADNDVLEKAFNYNFFQYRGCPYSELSSLITIYTISNSNDCIKII